MIYLSVVTKEAPPQQYAMSGGQSLATRLKASSLGNHISTIQMSRKIRGQGSTLLSFNHKMLNKFPKRFRHHGIVSCPFAYSPPPSYKLYPYIRQRYGYPDIQFLATLKYKIWIYRFYMMLMLDPGLFLFFDSSIWCLTWIFCLIMATLK